jgi:hypothetical protein
MMASLEGSRTSKVLPLAAATHAPSINSFRGCARNAALAGLIAERSLLSDFTDWLVAAAVFILKLLMGGDVVQRPEGGLTASIAALCHLGYKS